MKLFFLLLLFAGISFSASAQTGNICIKYLGSYMFPSDLSFDGMVFGGLSGLDRDNDGTFWAISDDRGGESGTPRFYNLSIDYNETGFTGVTINRQLFMKQPDGKPFPATARTVDPESIRVSPTGTTLYWSSEGNWDHTPSNRYQPFIREMTLDGTYVRTLPTPSLFDYVDNKTTGGRSNKLFESLSIAPDGTLWSATEDALFSDGPATSLSSGSVVRFIALDPDTGKVKAQYAYPLPLVPKAAAPGAPFPPDNGLSEFLALSDTRFITVERAFAFGRGWTIRLALADITGASDVSSLKSLEGAPYNPIGKKYILDLETLGIPLDNIEGITWGKTLANGNRTLVLVSDNNFNPEQRTILIVLELSETQVDALQILPLN